MPWNFSYQTNYNNNETENFFSMCGFHDDSHGGKSTKFAVVRYVIA